MTGKQKASLRAPVGASHESTRRPAGGPPRRPLAARAVPKAAAPLLLLLLAAPAAGQEAAADSARLAPASDTVALLAAPGGTRLATLRRAARLHGGGEREGWREATLEGWLPAAGVAPDGRDGFPISASRDGALLSEPDGDTLAAVRTGMRFREVAREGGWVRVRRAGWVRAAAVAAAGPAPGATPAAPPVELRSTPDGGPIATVEPGAPMRVLERRDGWTRVRVEGWTRAEVPDEPAGAPVAGATLRLVRERPDDWTGRTVAWTVHFVGLERADSLRPDFTPGEPYFLARDPNGEPGLVYVAVPPDRAAEVRRLLPFQRVRVTGRIRTARSALTGHPVLELVRLDPLDR